MRMKALLTAFAAVLAAGLQAAVPIMWKSDVAKPETERREAFHGTTLELEATLVADGRPLAVTNGEAWVYWQTNGMGAAFWSADAAVSGNVVRATFTPEMDPGAAVVNGFLGTPREQYAAFQLRFRPSPGAEPNVLLPPVVTLDFARVTVTNAPWATPSITNGLVTASITNGLVTASITNGLVSLDSLAPSVAAVVTNEVEEWSEWTILSYGVEIGGRLYYVDNTWYYENEYGEYVLPVFPEDATSLVWNIGDDSYTATRQRFTGNALGLATTNDLADIRAEMGSIGGAVESVNSQTGAVVLAASDVGAYPATDGATLAGQVTAIGAHLNAEDAHFVSTNYDSVTHLPEAYVEIKMRDEATGSNTWITIWREMTRWTKFVGSAFNWQTWSGFYSWATNVTTELSHKADRCWGAYDSETGGYSPDGYVQVSTSNILIAAGMAYQRTVTSGGAVWVLQCNQGVAHVGGETNGYFRICDGDGTVQFEIVKGDKREMGADADGITLSGSSVIIPYSVEAEAHPTLQICGDLAAGAWKAETEADCLATVSWAGESGGYVATVTPKSAMPAMFVRATYMAGGETYIRNVAPISAHGGILCTDGVHKVRPVYNNGTVTWEVVQ